MERTQQELIQSDSILMDNLQEKIRAQGMDEKETIPLPDYLQPENTEEAEDGESG